MFLIPVIDRPVKVDLREQFIEVPSQTTITKDNAPINIDFLIYWKIVDPLRSIVNVAYFAGALQGIATTTLRAVIGDILLDDVLSKREQINEVLRTKLDEQTERWGGKVTTVEIREIIPPRDVQDAMNRMLSAERNRRAVITESEGARQSNINVAEGEKQAAILRAEGKRQSAILEAEGFSQALERIFSAARDIDERTMTAPVPRGAQGARRQPVDQVRPAARAHRARPAVGDRSIGCVSRRRPQATAARAAPTPAARRRPGARRCGPRRPCPRPWAPSGRAPARPARHRATRAARCARGPTRGRRPDGAESPTPDPCRVIRGYGRSGPCRSGTFGGPIVG